MQADIPNHEPSLMLMNCGDAQMSRPSLGAWVTYGLGTENQNLPGFVAMCPGGYPIKDAENWQSGFLPGVYQGTFIDSQHTDLQTTDREHQQQLRESPPPSASSSICSAAQRRASTRSSRRRSAPWEARIQSFELAYRMQMEAADAFDISQEPQHIREMYGEGVHARQTLIARRLLERGGALRTAVARQRPALGQSQRHPAQSNQALQGYRSADRRAAEGPQAAAAVLEDTLVIWGGGVRPHADRRITRQRRQADDGPRPQPLRLHGLDGRRRRQRRPRPRRDRRIRLSNPSKTLFHVHDLHATILHLLGFDHEKFTYRYAGRDFRLTDVHGHVVHDIVA